MKEVFWTRELAWEVEPTPRAVAEGVVVRKEKEGCGALVSRLEDVVCGGDATSDRN
jgi:hypothetical protein